MPNHYQPWSTAWQDGIVFFLLALALLLQGRPARLLRFWCLFFGVLIVSVIGQFFGGIIYFGGDAAVVVLYLLGFAAAITVGDGLASEDAANPQALNAFLVVIVLSALVSAATAMVQWLSLSGMGIWVVDLPPQGRPFGNLAQPNHLSTVCFLGLVAALMLHLRRQIRLPVFFCVAACLMFGMALSGSRTGWLQVSTLVIAGLFHRVGPDSGVRRWLYLGIASIYGALVVYLPTVNEVLGLSGRSHEAQLQAGLRLLHWQTMLDAILARPWAGYGWLQVSVAQWQSVTLRPAVGEHIEYAHNMGLDLLVWLGLPIGIGVICLLTWWWLTTWFRCRNLLTQGALMAVTGLFVHCLLEYPHAYAFFLIPLGLMIGLTTRREQRAQGYIASACTVRISGLAFSLLLLLVARDYALAEPAHRTLRMETARIGGSGLKTQLPDLPVLTQIGAFQSFIQTSPRAGLSVEQLELARRVAQRFAYPPSMFRYATMAGLNGYGQDASTTLLTLCKMHPAVACEDARIAWATAQKTMDGLSGQFPETVGRTGCLVGDVRCLAGSDPRLGVNPQGLFK